MQKTSTRRRMRARLTGRALLEETDAARDARLCGAMDSTGVLCAGDGGCGLFARKFRTSVWDCSVIRTDSADVMQPLGAHELRAVSVLFRVTYLHAKQSFRLICAVSSFFPDLVDAVPFTETS